MDTAPPTRVALLTEGDGRARFHESPIALTEGTPASRLSRLMPSGGWQLRQSPRGFASDFHCTTDPQWVVILAGEMAIGLQDGSWRHFRPGQCFWSADVLPPGETFDATHHGHRSRQVGDEALVTMFVRG